MVSLWPDCFKTQRINHRLQCVLPTDTLFIKCIQAAHNIRTMHTHWTHYSYNLYRLHTLFVPCIQAIHIICTIDTGYTLYVHIVYRLHTLLVPCIHPTHIIRTMHTSYTHYSYIVYKLDTLFVHCIQAIQIIRTLYTGYTHLFVHCIRLSGSVTSQQWVSTATTTHMHAIAFQNHVRTNKSIHRNNLKRPVNNQSSNKPPIHVTRMSCLEKIPPPLLPWARMSVDQTSNIIQI